MVAISIKDNLKQVKRELQKKRSQVPFAMSLTLNDIAFSGKKQIDTDIKTRLDRPTRFTQRSIEVVKSNKRNLTSTVKVRDRQKQSKVLEHLFSGGSRTGKGAEGALLGLGVLPKGKYIVPGNDAPLDSFGNIKRSFIRKLIQYFRTFKPSRGNKSTLPPGVWMRKFDRAEKRNRKKKGLTGSFEFFAVHKQVTGGGGKRKGKGRKPEPILLFIDKPRYRQYFDIRKTANRIILKDLDRSFKRNYDFATRTAK